MKILNLVNENQSDIKYKISRFPDGQQNLIITQLFHAGYSDHSPVTIKSRLNNFLDLELIIAATADLRELGVKEIHLYSPYFEGARSDRKFEDGGNNYLKHVICPIINAQKFESVTVLDPHSNCLEMGLNNFKSVSNETLVRFALSDIYSPAQEGIPTKWFLKDALFVSPDAGATHKIYKLIEQIGYKGDIITCTKERDTDGKLTKVVVPIFMKLGEEPKDIIIIDDICDGGRTFINISKEIDEIHKLIIPYTGKSKKYLIVTHGIFSAGFTGLKEKFDGIYCTNSYKDVFPSSKEGLDAGFVKQLNIF